MEKLILKTLAAQVASGVYSVELCAALDELARTRMDTAIAAMDIGAIKAAGELTRLTLLLADAEIAAAGDEEVTAYTTGCTRQKCFQDVKRCLDALIAA